MWWRVVLIVVVIAVVILGFWIYAEKMAEQLEAMAAQLEATQKELETANATIGRMQSAAERDSIATQVFVDSVDKGAKGYVEKMHDVEADDDACDWLDALLPDSLRKHYGCSANGGYDDTAAGVLDAAMREAGAGTNGN